MSAELLRRAAWRMRVEAKAATPGPWRDSSIDGNRYSAVVSDTMPQGRRPGSGFDETEGYGGYLIGESIQTQDRRHVASWHPIVTLAVADWLDEEARCYERDYTTSRAAVAVARAYLGDGNA